MMYQALDGRRIMRPCGLTDSPGGARPPATAAALIGLCWALRPISAWKRLACLGFAFLGVAAIYYTQVRVSFVMLVICLVGLTGMFVLQRNYRQAALLTTGGVVLVLASLAWVSRLRRRRGGAAVHALVNNDPASYYYEQPGGVRSSCLRGRPVGVPAGLRHGLVGDDLRELRQQGHPQPIWVEVMWPAWIYDGGLPLLIVYVGALAAAMFRLVADRAAQPGPRARLLGGGDRGVEPEHRGHLLQLSHLPVADRHPVLAPVRRAARGRPAVAVVGREAAPRRRLGGFEGAGTPAAGRSRRHRLPRAGGRHERPMAPGHRLAARGAARVIRTEPSLCATAARS